MNEVTGMTKDKESQHAQAQEEKHFQKSTRRVLCGLLLCAVLVLFLLGRQHRALSHYYESAIPFYNFFYHSLEKIVDWGISSCSDTYSVRGMYLIYERLYILEDLLEEIEHYCTAGPQQVYAWKGKDSVTFQGKTTQIQDGEEGSAALKQNLQQLLQDTAEWMDEERHVQNPEAYQDFLTSTEAYITEIRTVALQYAPESVLTPEGLMEWYITVMGETKEASEAFAAQAADADLMYLQN